MVPRGWSFEIAAAASLVRVSMFTSVEMLTSGTYELRVHVSISPARGDG